MTASAPTESKGLSRARAREGIIMRYHELTTEDFRNAAAMTSEIYAQILAGLAEGECKHGVYTGGCGPDWMCQACESGEDDRTPYQVARDRALYEAHQDALGRVVSLIAGIIEREGHTARALREIQRYIDYFVK